MNNKMKLDELVGKLLNDETQKNIVQGCHENEALLTIGYLKCQFQRYFSERRNNTSREVQV